MAWMPYIVIIDDLYRTMKECSAKWMEPTEATDNGRVFTYNKLVSGKRDIKINILDGAGMHTPGISRKIQKHSGVDFAPCAIMWRSPFLKGVTTQMDIAGWCAAHSISEITDMFGNRHDVHDVEIVMTKSMWKGAGFFANWDEYLRAWHRYDHCMGYVKFNTPSREEKKYTRANYQILQDLQIPFEQFSALAEESKKWGEGIAGGLEKYIWNFAGLTYLLDAKTGKLVPPEPKDAISEAILRNPDAMRDPHIRKHFIRQAEKYFKEMCCGKLWLRGTFRILVPDMIAMLEHAAGMDAKGCLAAGECYTRGVDGAETGELIIERNPHISRSEHCFLRGTEETEWTQHLEGVLMLNTWDATLPKLSGADMDGDLALVLRSDDYPQFRNGTDSNAPIILGEV